MKKKKKIVVVQVRIDIIGYMSGVNSKANIKSR